MKPSSVVDVDAAAGTHELAETPAERQASGQTHLPIVLRSMIAAQPQRRASMYIFRKQRSQESTRGKYDGGQPAQSVANRTTPLPRLHHHLSLVMKRTLVGRDGSGLSLQSTEEQHKIERYERMMDRFQLRRVPVARTVSTRSARQSLTAGTWSTQREGGAPTETRSQPHSRRSSMDITAAFAAAAAAVVAAADTNTNGSIQGAATSGHDVELPATDGPTEPVLQKPAVAHSSTHSLRPIINTDRVVSGTFDPAGLPTRLRLAALMLLYTSQLVYMPYSLVYHTHHSASVVLDSVTDAMFLLNVLATCNTATQTARGQLVTTRRAIWRQYRHNGFFMDVLAAVPFAIMTHYAETAPLVRYVLCILQLTLQGTSLRRHVSMCHAMWKREAVRMEKSMLAWMLYSRYSHLVRIGGIVLMITLMAHYFACVWSLLLAQVDDGFLASSVDPFAIHLHSIYDVLQLLQGQGLPTSTLVQDLFGSFAVLLGSIVFAVVFGHVAILVSNFNANHTTYQRKMERVFSIMDKLQLPHPIRERIHQYYEYLHAEYESLDAEVVKFAKELSHTLELEVVLFKYMDVVMHVPHWHDCSPDFQKQLALSLCVRVYLPDDFIMREGEVGTECYIISRGTCKQLAYSTGNYEPPTMAMISKGIAVPQAGSQGQRSSQMAAQNPGAAVKPIMALTRGPSRYSLRSSGRSEEDPMNAESNTRMTVLKRGQAIGAMSLLCNYSRSSDLRAATYVEMCVIERETFQRILTRYPNDREIVLSSIVHHTMLHVAAERAPCMFMQMVQTIVPTASVSTGIRLVGKAMNARENDPTILFGVTEQLTSRMQEITAREMADETAGGNNVGDSPSTSVPVSANDPETAPNGPIECDTRHRTLTPPAISSSTDADLVRRVSEIHERLVRVEERQEICCNCRKARQQPTAPSSKVQPPPKPRLLSRISPPVSLHYLQRRNSARPLTSSTRSGLMGTEQDEGKTSPLRVPMRLFHRDRAAATQPSPTPIGRSALSVHASHQHTLHPSLATSATGKYAEI